MQGECPNGRRSNDFGQYLQPSLKVVHLLWRVMMMTVGNRLYKESHVFQWKKLFLWYLEYMKIKKGLCNMKLTDYCSLLYIFVMCVVRPEKTGAVNFCDANNGSHFQFLLLCNCLQAKIIWTHYPYLILRSMTVIYIECMKSVPTTS